MPIKRCSAQTRQTLEEFYLEMGLSENQVSADGGKAMLSILELINKTFLETNIYGLTSLAHLLLYSNDDPQTAWNVTIISNGLDYFIEYVTPNDPGLGYNAKIKGSILSLEKLKKDIIIAMAESQGWTKSDELKRLFELIK